MSGLKYCQPEELNRFFTEFIFREEDSQGALFDGEEQTTRTDTLSLDGINVPVYINEFWTSRQRQASSLHEISYRACFKPQLPRFFIDRLTEKNDLVYDPFSGRGTTVIEAALRGRNIIANDVNPLSRILSEPRLTPPHPDKVRERLETIPMKDHPGADIDLSMFYHPQTEAEIVSLRSYLAEKRASGREDMVDQWIRMTATNRLTGHSKGFFSVYTLPPNQAVSQQSQQRINIKRNQKPEYRDTKAIILKKTTSLLRNLSSEETANLADATGKAPLFLSKDVAQTKEIESDSVDLLVTSPPFLKVVQYSTDNWLRCWFNGLDAESLENKITESSSINKWSEVMAGAFLEFHRLMRSGGWVAFEVGEVNKKKTRLEDYVVPLGMRAGFTPMAVIINSQDFTKTANIWGVSNNKRGTNTNRIVLFRK